MDTKQIPVSFFSDVPNIADLVRMLGRVVSDWWSARFFSIDFRELDDSEVTDEMRRNAEIGRNTPKEDLIQI